MKLIYRIILRLLLVMVVVLTVWASFFYVAVMDEVNDEMDDTLENYSERIMVRVLTGEELPESWGNQIGNNQFFLHEVSEEYAESHDRMVYRDSMIYMTDQNEFEPARVLTTVFKASDSKYQALTVLMPSIEKIDLAQAISNWMIFLFVALLVVVTCVNTFVFQRSMRPLYALLTWLDNYRMGSKNPPLEIHTNITEFKKLNEAAIRHTNRNEQLFEQQKQFIGNASHEIQTPLAICRNRLEMLMEDEELSEHQMSELIKTHQTLEFITKLNKSLLLLAKIDNGQFVDVKQIDFVVLLHKFLSDYQEVYAYKHIEVSLNVQGNMQMNMSETLAEILITNLLRNAFVHNLDKDGKINIFVNEKSFVIQNTGVDSPLNPKVFERFYQGQKKEGSTGLGLAIVDSICRQQHIGLDYSFEKNMHRFSLRVV